MKESIGFDPVISHSPIYRVESEYEANVFGCRRVSLAMPPPFGATWGTLRDRCEELPEDATLITPLATKRFRITDVQDLRIIIEDTDTGDTQPLQREQFETLAEPVGDSTPANADGGFPIERLPPEAEPYAAVLAIHPRYVIDEQAGTLVELDEADDSAVLDDAPHLSTTTDVEETTDRAEPEVTVYADMLLLIDALERETPTDLEEIETPALVNLYTLLSDVQRNANDLCKDVSEVLLDRVGHDRPVHGQYGSVQRTRRRQRSLKDDDDVLAALESAGIDREQVLAVNREKVDEALDVVELPESAVYETDESEYVRKAEVDEERKETRLQGLKDRLAVSDDPEAEVLRQEVDRLEARSEDLTQFSPGSAFDTLRKTPDLIRPFLSIHPHFTLSAVLDTPYTECKFVQYRPQSYYSTRTAFWPDDKVIIDRFPDEEGQLVPG